MLEKLPLLEVPLHDINYILIRKANEPPVVDFTSPDNNSAFLISDTITLEAKVIDDGEVDNVAFYIGPKKLGQVDSPPYKIDVKLDRTGNNYIRAIATDDNGYTGWAQLVIVINNVTQLIENIANTEQIKVYPNPSNSDFTISYRMQQAKLLRIYNFEGKLILQLKNPGSNQLIINDKSKFGPGLYLVEVIGKNGERINQKFIVY